MYMITNFVVSCNGGKIRCTDHKYKINFVPSTLINEVQDTSIDMLGIHLKPFDDVLGRCIEVCYLVGNDSTVHIFTMSFSFFIKI